MNLKGENSKKVLNQIFNFYSSPEGFKSTIFNVVGYLVLKRGSVRTFPLFIIIICLNVAERFCSKCVENYLSVTIS